MQQNTLSSTTQKFLDIFDITNDIIILQDGSVSMVLQVTAMNFDLLSEAEQDASIYSYAALLNSLSFPIQIIVSSRPKDVTGYLRYVEQRETEIVNPVYKERIQEYRAFIGSMVKERNVLDKRFYAVVPFSASEMGFSTNKLPLNKKHELTDSDKHYIIQKARTNLDPRRDHLMSQFGRIGLYARQLNTQELIQLLYASYNPESFEGQKITHSSSYTVPLVSAQIQKGFSMTDQTQTPQAQQAPQPQQTGQQVTQQQPQPTTTQQNPQQQPAQPITQTAGIAESPLVQTPNTQSQGEATSSLGVTTPANMSSQANPMPQTTPPNPATPTVLQNGGGQTPTAPTLTPTQTPQAQQTPQPTQNGGQTPATPTQPATQKPSPNSPSLNSTVQGETKTPTGQTEQEEINKTLGQLGQQTKSEQPAQAGGQAPAEPTQAPPQQIPEL